MKIIWLFLFVLLPSLVSANNDIYGDITINEVTSIYDADTFRVNISSWPEIIGKRVPVRVLGIDAPEIRGKCESEKKMARQAKQFTVAKLREGKQIILRNIQRGKYFRILANVSIDGEDLSKQLIQAGLARPYDGGKRQGWCQ